MSAEEMLLLAGPRSVHPDLEETTWVDEVIQ